MFLFELKNYWIWSNMAITLGALLGVYDGSQSFSSVGSWEQLNSSTFSLSSTYTHSSNLSARVSPSGSNIINIRYLYSQNNDYYEKIFSDVNSHRCVTHFWGSASTSASSGQCVAGIFTSTNNDITAGISYFSDGRPGRYSCELVATNSDQLAFSFVSTIATNDFYFDDVLTATDVVDLDVSLNYQSNRTQNVAYNQTQGYRLSSYKWSDYGEWSLPIKYLNNTIANLINYWWEKDFLLKYTNDRYNNEEIFVVKISSNESPFLKRMKPYSDLFEGVIKIQSITNGCEF